MGDKTKIEWTDASWNPIRAARTGPAGDFRIGWHCEHVSEGCKNCYAESINRRLGTGRPFKPGHLVREGRAGDVTVFLDEKMLTQPLRWKRPRMIFVCSMSDLFGSFVSDEMIDRVFAVMALCPQHTFQVLTKRPERARVYLSSDRRADLPLISDDMGPKAIADRVLSLPWPLRNVWLGTSVEDQTAADERIPHLLAAPAAVRFLSAEPLLGPVSLTSIDPIGHQRAIGASGWSAIWKDNHVGRAWLDWVIVGSESGRGARPCDLAWVRSLRDQCTAAGVAFFWKQHVINGRKVGLPELDGRTWAELPQTTPSRARAR